MSNCEGIKVSVKIASCKAMRLIIIKLRVANLMFLAYNK